MGIALKRSQFDVTEPVLKPLKEVALIRCTKVNQSNK